MFSFIDAFFRAATGENPENQPVINGTKELANRGFAIEAFGPLGLS